MNCFSNEVLFMNQKSLNHNIYHLESYNIEYKNKYLIYKLLIINKLIFVFPI